MKPQVKSWASLSANVLVRSDKIALLLSELVLFLTEIYGEFRVFGPTLIKTEYPGTVPAFLASDADIRRRPPKAPAAKPEAPRSAPIPVRSQSKSRRVFAVGRQK